MIRFFDAFRKSLFHKTSDFLLFEQASATFSEALFVCPKCGAKHNCSPFTPYNRYIITYENRNILCKRVSVKRVICHSCDSTHAILPDCLVPFSSYALSFILHVLQAYFERRQSVVAICEHFQISISTLYAWIHRFKLHKHQWLGLLQDAETTSLDFLKTLFTSDFSAELFFKIAHVSFLQYAFTTPSDSS